MQKLLSANNVAKRLSISCSCSTVYRLINAGLLEAVNVGVCVRPQWRIRESSVNGILNRKNDREQNDYERMGQI